MKTTIFVTAVLSATLIVSAAQAQERPNPRPATRVVKPSIAVPSPDLASLLKLTAKQREQLANHFRDITLRLNAAMVGGQPDPETLRRIGSLNRLGIKKILTPQQWTKYQVLPFKPLPQTHLTAN